MKLGQLVNGETALAKLAALSLPLNISWDLRKFIKLAAPEITTFKEIRDAKIREYGEIVMDSEGKPTSSIKVKDEHLSTYQLEMNALSDKDLDIAVPVIKVAELLAHKDANGKGIDMSSNELGLLEGWLITE